MYVAICDDDPAQLSLLTAYVRSWGEKAGEIVQTEVYHSAEELLFAWGGEKPEGAEERKKVLLLDIEMRDMSGLELARILRDRKEAVEIILVTGHDRYMPDGYDVGALQYLLKPVSMEKLEETLTRARDRLGEMPHLFFRGASKLLSVAPVDILYLEAEGHHTILHRKAGAERLLDSFSKVRENVEERSDLNRCLVPVHRGIMVNLMHVSALERGGVILETGERLPVSRSLEKSVMRAFLSWHGQDARGMGSGKS
ncbi:MAG: response regulator transcription factor [Clostridia bacterium]|nr:response regulator transcription factor [Clostridia bacterium]